jgi:hypothetical protein
MFARLKCPRVMHLHQCLCNAGADGMCCTQCFYQKSIASCHAIQDHVQSRHKLAMVGQQCISATISPDSKIPLDTHSHSSSSPAAWSPTADNMQPAFEISNIATRPNLKCEGIQTFDQAFQGNSNGPGEIFLFSILKIFFRRTGTGDFAKSPI